jgi:hypothetical protein
LQYWRQNKLGLGMGSCDSQATAIAVAEIPCRLFDIFRTVEQVGDMFENRMPGRRNRGQFFTRAFEYLDIEFIFKQFDLMADTRL